ncbi:MAG TPA: hypothetical protein VNG89_00170, partial [Vicinamibacterales bacterium]|nr:hypothetical protein [Vicinamibacterales bacterium]
MCLALAATFALTLAVSSARAPLLAQRTANPPPAPSVPTIDASDAAWERGDYIAAVNGYLRLLAAPGGDRWLRSIALTTGELFETRELTADGRAPRFSPDGALIVYET